MVAQKQIFEIIIFQIPEMSGALENISINFFF